MAGTSDWVPDEQWQAQDEDDRRDGSKKQPDAEEKGITLEKIEVQVIRQTEVNDEWKTQFSIKIDLGKGLNKREQVLLYNAARTCEVGRMISGSIQFEYQVV